MKYGNWSTMERPLQFFHKSPSPYEVSTQLFLYDASLSKLFTTSAYVDKSYCCLGLAAVYDVRVVSWEAYNDYLRGFDNA